MQGLRIFITQLFLLLFLNIGLFAQLIITPTNAVQAVQDVLVGGGVQISNMQFTGNIQALGKFTTGASNTNLGFSNGLILSSGKASQAAGLVSSFASTNNYSNSDPQLASLVSGSINDAAVLSFNFIPESDTITFRYVFASEEYPNYANSTYNDVFGFFLSGPNPNGGNYVFQNIAKIPGTNTPVSINNINNGTSNYGPCMNCTYYVNNQSPSNPYIAYNGATVVLTATAYVIPCLEYSIKLAIGDVNDGIYDSGVFLEANSFTSPRITIEPNYETNIIENSAIEGCSDVQVVFTLPYQSSSDRWIEYYFFGSANIDDDYTIDPPNQQYFIIPAGADSAILTINPINDGIIEGTEEIMLVVQTS
ncbi:MAG: choice-of-anchor L domain-containing protein, partial [Bacteroidales bacterium]|nr:choice-of-anchor L domain-containing protein [Bacteroidales bacterium]